MGGAPTTHNRQPTNRRYSLRSNARPTNLNRSFQGNRSNVVFTTPRVKNVLTE